MGMLHFCFLFDNYNTTMSLHPSHYYVVNGDVDKLNEETNETHHKETESSGTGDLGKFCWTVENKKK